MVLVNSIRFKGVIENQQVPRCQHPMKNQRNIFSQGNAPGENTQEHQSQQTLYIGGIGHPEIQVKIILPFVPAYFQVKLWGADKA